VFPPAFVSLVRLRRLFDLDAVPGEISSDSVGWSDALPESDLGILKALRTKTPSHAASLAERWRPWRAYAAMHLWKTLTETP